MEPAAGHPSDGDLVRRTRSGDRAAFGDLCDRYAKVVGVLAYQKIGNAGEAEDVVQEAFLKAYAALDELEDPERFGSWLYGIAFRAAIDWHRRRGRRGPSVSLDAGDGRRLELAAGGEAAVDGLLRDESARKVLEALGALPEKYRLVLTLRYLRAMSYKEIAEHLGEPAGTVANRIHRAAGLLREKLRSLVEA
jgi:RNA polymerase sigma-70 factor (ECF subfamily)